MERREDWESGWEFARCFVMRAKEPKEATMRPTNTSGFGPFRPPGGGIRASALARSFLPLANEHGHPLQPRVAHPLFTCISVPGRAGSSGHWRGALHCRLTSREPLSMSNFATVCTNSLDQLETTATQIAAFNVGSRITAMAWSSRTVSPSFSDDWSIESVNAAIYDSFDLPSHHFDETGLL